ncbi:hypothetical protein [Bradyrhizobium symbiodeficiens]|uniref:hypothetical protein n=1 Tax=Bradyrhizobium symbiodeficiens TaxID=1404367 RepID=UPI00140FC4A4|nr:hypothetical protein [Bradyrhizobium symbiodeficiens]QIO98283.1 hypothetical protein HAU86_02995 [Bradyrhizobium symbiodeficiens]
MLEFSRDCADALSVSSLERGNPHATQTSLYAVAQRLIGAASADNGSVNETISGPTETVLKRPGFTLLLLTGGFQMIELKLIAVVLGAGIFASMWSTDLGSDVVLAIIACLS